MIPLGAQLFIIFMFSGAWAVVFMAIIRRFEAKEAPESSLTHLSKPSCFGKDPSDLCRCIIKDLCEARKKTTHEVCVDSTLSQREATEQLEAPADCVECLARLELVFNRLMSREATLR